jgi:hypothetical protein
VAEMVLSSPAGGAGWNALAAAESQAARGLARALLAYSPGSAAIAALSGTMADGSESNATLPLICTAAVALGLSLIVLRNDLRKTAAAAPDFAATPAVH